MRVLIVEDNRRLAESIRDILKHWYDCDICGDGNTGCWLLKDGGYDAAVLDLMLPGMDGITLLREARKMGCQVPVLILTAKSELEDSIEEVKKHGVEITSSIAELLDKVDCVMLETNDGRIHLEQAMEVFKSGKICYIDKPIGATLGQAIAVYEMAEKYNVPIFSSSALRYSPQNQKLRNGEFGKILGADCYSPHKVEPTHPDFGFYGIHGVETLYTLMGTGCESVNRMSSKDADVVVGRWKDGRIGTFRGIKEGPAIYGGTAYTPKGAIAAGGYEGYKVLLDQILTFFKTGVAPISKEETIEIFTFMKASNMSKEQNGKIVTMEEAYRKGLKDAQKLIKTYK